VWIEKVFWTFSLEESMKESICYINAVVIVLAEYEGIHIVSSLYYILLSKSIQSMKLQNLSKSKLDLRIDLTS
jgi:hypothetical protein